MRRLFLAGLLCLGAAGLGGCEKPLFPESMPRTQYERYDRLRGRYIPSQQMNAYGGAQPALRERLAPQQD